MGLLEEWGDALAAESLREAAETFFGTRKSLEEEIAVFGSRVSALGKQSDKVRSWLAALACLLGSTESAIALLTTVGVQADPHMFALPDWSVRFPRLRYLTRKGFFFKTVWNIYETAAVAIVGYMQGSPYPDPRQPERILITINYEQLRKRCQEINLQIESINVSNRPSESLGFAKRMDQGLLQKEYITGGGAQSWQLDQELAFKPLIFEDYALPVFPKLPTDNAARDKISASCARIFKEQRPHVDSILEEILSSSDGRVCSLQRGKGSHTLV